MDRVHWLHAVMLVCSKSGEIIVISSPSEALALLKQNWPAAEGEAHRAAVEICSKVATGETSGQDARIAFLAAIDEAGIPVAVSP